MRPATYLRRGLRRALRRRYAYRALRDLRQAAAAAVARHWALTMGVRPYNGADERERMYALYLRGLRRLQRRWPALDLDDPRAAK